MYYFKRIVAFVVTLYLSIYLYSSDQYASDNIINLRPYAVTGTIGYKQIEESIVPASELSGDELTRLKGHTLGETLDGIAGVHSTSFGAGASRPIIRGFEGPRVHIMEDGLGTLDVSDTSPDHAVTVIPDFAEYIDVIRGPATLLYGNSAIGGVVNVIGARVPVRRDLPPFRSEVETHYESASEGWDLAGAATVARKSWALRVNTSWMNHNDYSIPGYAESARTRAAEQAEEVEEEHEHEEEAKGTLPNSFVDNLSVNVGWSLFPSDQSRVSLAVFHQQSEYGVPGHEHRHEHGEEGEEDHDHEHAGSVYVDLDQSKFDLDAEFRFESPVWKALQTRFLYADYEHKEIEGDEVGTHFKRKGWEARVEGTHRFTVQNQGVVGLQLSNSDYKAAGEEAMNPDSEVLDLALFALEEWSFDRLVMNLGARVERRDLDAGEVGSYDGWTVSLSAASKYRITENLDLNVALSRSERGPMTTELFADGSHVATRQYEIGNPDLDKESSWSLDTGFQFTANRWTARINAYYYRFSDYIFAVPTADYEDGFQVFRYESVDTIFYGAELEVEHVVFTNAEGQLVVQGMADVVKADIVDSPENLPRIAPTRIGAGFTYTRGRWSLWSRGRYSFEQNETAENEFPTDSYLSFDLGLEYTLPGSSGSAKAFVKVTNLLDEEIRKHTSFLKEVAPLPGRNIILGFTVKY